jgi:hypothetical protein
LFLVVPAALVFLLFFRVIPPITGNVLNALTGAPVRGVSVTLQTSHYQGWAVHTEVKDVSTTGVFGWYFLTGLIGWRGLPLPDFRSYWLTVNEGIQSGGQEEDSAETRVLYNPLSNQGGWPVVNQRYFPTTVTFRLTGCDRVWSATCVHGFFWWGQPILLIPVLDDVNDCRKIHIPSVRERCRQLNTYRAAFLHVASYEEMKKGKALCNAVDGGFLTTTCLQQIALHAGNNPPPAPIPLDIFRSFDGVPIYNKGCGPQLAFSGRFSCGAGYASGTLWLASISVETYPDSPATSEPPPWNPQYTDHEQATVGEEQRPGGNVLRYHGPQHDAFFWYSGQRHVEVFFYRPIPQMEEFVSYYLEEFPSSMR